MTPSLILGFVWVLAASLIAVMPRRYHWPGAAVLIAAGVPLIGWIAWQNGVVAGVIALAAGASILRWPVIYLVRWLRGRLAP